MRATAKAARVSMQPRAARVDDDMAPEPPGTWHRGMVHYAPPRRERLRFRSGNALSLHTHATPVDPDGAPPVHAGAERTRAAPDSGARPRGALGNPGRRGDQETPRKS